MATKEGFKGAVKERIKEEIVKREEELINGSSKSIKEKEEVGKLASFGGSSGDHAATDASFVPDYAGGRALKLETEISLLEQALKRVDAGTYYICSVCGEPITMKMLDAVPWARDCTPCRSEKEAAGKKLVRKYSDPTKQRYAFIRV